jgi:DNA polymerase III subunit delta'
MQFKEVTGQQAVKTHLLDMAQQDAIPHAQLFLSNPGSGGLATALAFAQYLVCENGDIQDSCGVCPSCIKAGKMIHPDIHFTYPVIPKKPSPHPSLSVDYIQEWREAVVQNPYINELEWLQFIEAENKQGNISADEARNIIRNLSLKSFESRYKIHIIWMAEALGKEGNILLKLLEEPTDNTILILVAENQEEVLPTILSRCQLVKLNKLDDDSIQHGLIQRGISPDIARRIAFLAHGNFSEALRMTLKETDDSTLMLTDWLKYSIHMNPVVLVKWIDEISKTGRENLKSFLEYMLHVFRETILARSQHDYQPRLNAEEKKIAQALFKYLDREKLEQIIHLIDKKHYEIERNVNPKIIFLDLSIRFHSIIAANKSTT